MKPRIALMILAMACCVAIGLGAEAAALPTDATQKTKSDEEVTVGGAVSIPGRYRITPQSTLAEVVKKAGLRGDSAGVVRVLRKGEKKGFIVSWRDPSFRLLHDDDLVVLGTK